MAQVAKPAFVARADDVGAIRQAAEDLSPPQARVVHSMYHCVANPSSGDPDARMVRNLWDSPAAGYLVSNSDDVWDGATFRHLESRNFC